MKKMSYFLLYLELFGYRLEKKDVILEQGWLWFNSNQPLKQQYNFEHIKILIACAGNR